MSLGITLDAMKPTFSEDEAAILFANEAFYAAFANADADEMNALWSESAPVTCIHPGQEILIGRDTVMESWEAILEGAGEEFDIACVDAAVSIIGDVAVVTCYERLADGILAATNVFHREGRTWLLVHHQAGPTVMLEELEDEGRSPPMQ